MGGKRKSAGDDQGVVRWVGAPMSRDYRGDVYYGGCIIDGTKYNLGDCVIVDGGEDREPYIARIDTLWEDTEGKACFIAHWYYRPEDTIGGRQEHHLFNEVFETNEVDENELLSILDEAIVVPWDEYQQLESVERAKENVFICRYHYSSANDKFIPLMAKTLTHSSKRNRREALMGLAKPIDENNQLTTATIMEAVAGEDKFVKAAAALRLACVPPSLPCREGETAEITSILEQGITKGKLNGCLYISGVPGTGKTASVQSVIRKLRMRVDEEDLPEFHYVEINAQRLPTPPFLYALLWEALSGQSLSPAQALASLDRRFKQKSSAKHRCCVLLVDELDHLVSTKQTVLYNLFDWPTRPGARLIVIGIANTMDLPERMLPRIASRLGLQRVAFKPYTSDQIRTIVKARLEGLSAFEGDAIELVSRKVAAASGDVRKALQIAGAAALVAKRENAPNVTVFHVQTAVTEMDRSCVSVGIQNSSFQERLFLVALFMELKTSGTGDVTVEQVCRRCRLMADPLDVACPPLPLLLALCTRLCDKQLIETKGSAKKTVEFLVPSQDISFALREDPLLSRWTSTK